MTDPLSTLHSLAQNKPGTIFTSRDAQAVVTKLDELSDAVIHLGGRSRKAAKKTEIDYEIKIREILAEVMKAKA